MEQVSHYFIFKSFIVDFVSFNDLWVYDVDNDEWTQIQPTNPAAITARVLAACGIDTSSNGTLYVHGGANIAENPSTIFSDIWQFDFGSNTWTRADTGYLASSESYLKLAGHSMTIDPYSKTLNLYLGFTGSQCILYISSYC